MTDTKRISDPAQQNYGTAGSVCLQEGADTTCPHNTQRDPVLSEEQGAPCSGSIHSGNSHLVYLCVHTRLEITLLN